mmetsp:Transcript_35345/g.56780  ORF Transcript_35345/g.56780 Transcript_35345/m.56780 type:complete len:90 (-) Transcript_35345:234-503(-)
MPLLSPSSPIPQLLSTVITNYTFSFLRFSFYFFSCYKYYHYYYYYSTTTFPRQDVNHGLEKELALKLSQAPSYLLAILQCHFQVLKSYK